MKSLISALAFLSCATVSQAEERRLLGDEIHELHSDAEAFEVQNLEDMEAGRPHWRQEFFSDGRTIYYDGRNGKPSDGLWEVRGNQYCSTWGRGGVWECYNVYVDESGAKTVIVWEGVDDLGVADGARFPATISHF
jgi:hypothetical protein